MRNDDEEIRTVFCGNLSEDVTDGILFELFNQAGPVESVRRPKDPNGRPKAFGFIVFKHDCSVPYAVELFKGTKLFNRNINVNTRFDHLYHIPVLDTHLTEFTGLRGNPSELGRSRHSHEGNDRNNRSRRDDFNHRLKEGQVQDKALSWAELKNNPLHANRLPSNHLEPYGLQNPYRRENVAPPLLPDINALLQLGQQMIIPAIMGLQGMAGMPNLPVMGLGPCLGNNIFPSMQGRMNGGERHSLPIERGRRGNEGRERGSYDDRERRDSHEGRVRRDHNSGRESRRDHPYDDRHRNHREEHKHHDRGYSSSRSSHDRERRDRRSR